MLPSKNGDWIIQLISAFHCKGIIRLQICSLATGGSRVNLKKLVLGKKRLVYEKGKTLWLILKGGRIVR